MANSTNWSEVITNAQSSIENTFVAKSSVTIESMLVKQLAREKGQFIRAAKVGPNHYRVNWFVLDGYSNRIVKSRFLRVVANGDTLTIEDKTLEGGPKSKLEQFLR